MPVLAIVIPCFNEAESLNYTVLELSSLLKKLSLEKIISHNSFLFFVDDGCTDKTWEKLSEWNKKNNSIKGLKLSKNFGHQAALMAGLTDVSDSCDVSISIDADLQQDPEAIRDFLIKFNSGADVVLGIRSDRKTDSWFKKETAKAFYSFMKTMGVKIIPNHADYRLLSNRALKALLQFPEPNIFLRGICLQLGFKVEMVHFIVKDRQFGKTSYTLKKMFQLAIHGITSFSILPLRIVAIMGMLICSFSFVMGMYVLWHALFLKDAIPGWASTTFPIYFLGGVQLFCMGIIGEYVGQIYTTVKNRPRWINESRLT
jgi:glycosyltransferase involved in cell wall biosynthesis